MAISIETFIHDKEYRELFSRGYINVLDEDLMDVQRKERTEEEILAGHLHEVDGDKTNPFYVGVLQAFEDHRDDCCIHWKHVESGYCCFHKEARKTHGEA